MNALLDNPRFTIKAMTLCAMACLPFSSVNANESDHAPRDLDPESAKYDTDGDGKLSKEEMISGKKAWLDNIVANYDADGDGKINAEEKQAARDAGVTAPPFLRRLEAAHGGERKEKYLDIQEKLKEQVDNGEITEEQAKQRLAQLKKRFWGNDKKPNIAELKKRIEAAVADGKITQEEADKKLQYLRKRMTHDRPPAHDRKKPSLKTMQQRLKAAVESGRLTQDQADAKLEWMKKRLESDINR